MPLAVPLAIEKAGGDRVRITLDGQEVELARETWSDWVAVEFDLAGVHGRQGLVRLYLVEGSRR